MRLCGYPQSSDKNTRAKGGRRILCVLRFPGFSFLPNELRRARARRVNRAIRRRRPCRRRRRRGGVDERRGSPIGGRWKREGAPPARRIDRIRLTWYVESGRAARSVRIRRPHLQVSSVTRGEWPVDVEARTSRVTARRLP